MPLPLIDQYILVVNNRRGFNEFQLFKSLDAPVDTSDTSQWQLEAQTRISDGVSVQETLPGITQTFTISAQEP